MGKRFLGGTDLYEYEMLMQEYPQARNIGGEDKKLKRRYFRLLERLISESGLVSVRYRIIKGVKEMMFQEFCYVSREHESTFGIAYSKLISSKEKDENDKLAVVYLLSASPKLYRLLHSYMYAKKYELPERSEVTEEAEYNLYVMAKRILGNERYITIEDMLEPDLIEDKTLSIMVNAMFLQKYGIRAIYEETPKKKKQYKNAPRYHRTRYKTYSYKNQAVKYRM